MSVIISEERPDSADAIQLIDELQSHLNPEKYPAESKHGYSVDKLLREGVIFFVMRQAEIPAGAKILANNHGSAPGIWLEDERGRWVLGPHTETSSEHRVRARAAGKTSTYVMDRIFRTTDGERWIVDRSSKAWRQAASRRASTQTAGTPA